MQTKKIALIVAFSTISIVLNPTISRLAIPVFYIPSTQLMYQFFEIPIIVALLLLDLKAGVVVAALNSIALAFLYPGQRFMNPIGNFVAVTSMMTGISLATSLHKRRKGKKPGLTGTKTVLFSTGLGIVFRIIAMTPMWYVMVRISYPLLTVSSFFALVFPLMAVYNATLPLYTVPIAFFIARTVDKNLRVGSSQNSNAVDPTQPILKKCPTSTKI